MHFDFVVRNISSRPPVSKQTKMLYRNSVLHVQIMLHIVILPCHYIRRCWRWHIKMTWGIWVSPDRFSHYRASYPYFLPSFASRPAFVFRVPSTIISVTNNGVRDYTVRLVTTLGNTVATKSNNNPQEWALICKLNPTSNEELLSSTITGK